MATRAAMKRGLDEKRTGSTTPATNASASQRAKRARAGTAPGRGGAKRAKKPAPAAAAPQSQAAAPGPSAAARNNAPTAAAPGPRAGPRARARTTAAAGGSASAPPKLSKAYVNKLDRIQNAINIRAIFDLYTKGQPQCTTNEQRKSALCKLLGTSRSAQAKNVRKKIDEIIERLTSANAPPIVTSAEVHAAERQATNAARAPPQTQEGARVWNWALGDVFGRILGMSYHMDMTAAADATGRGIGAVGRASGTVLRPIIREIGSPLPTWPATVADIAASARAAPNYHWIVVAVVSFARHFDFTSTMLSPAGFIGASIANAAVVRHFPEVQGCGLPIVEELYDLLSGVLRRRGNAVVSDVTIKRLTLIVLRVIMLWIVYEATRWSPPGRVVNGSIYALGAWHRGLDATIAGLTPNLGLQRRLQRLLRAPVNWARRRLRGSSIPQINQSVGRPTTDPRYGMHLPPMPPQPDASIIARALQATLMFCTRPSAFTAAMLASPLMYMLGSSGFLRPVRSQ